MQLRLTPLKRSGGYSAQQTATMLTLHWRLAWLMREEGDLPSPPLHPNSGSGWLITPSCPAGHRREALSSARSLWRSDTYEFLPRLAWAPACVAWRAAWRRRQRSRRATTRAASPARLALRCWQRRWSGTPERMSR